jgi:hypothetical protein
MRKATRVLGTIGLAVAVVTPSTVPTTDDHLRNPLEQHDGTGPHLPFYQPARGPVDYSDFMAGAVRVSVTGAGSIPPGGVGAGTVAVMVEEVVEPFILTEVEFEVMTEGVRFLGTPVVSAEIDTTASLSSDRRFLKLTTPDRRRSVPWVHSIVGMHLEADRQLEEGTAVRFQISVRSPRRITNRQPLPSPGTISG